MAGLRLLSLGPSLGFVKEPVTGAGTVMDNLRCGRPGSSDAQIKAAAKALGADEILLSLPAGYASLVGERGARLSHGQRQAICCVRALLADPRILVVSGGRIVGRGKHAELLSAGGDYSRLYSDYALSGV